MTLIRYPGSKDKLAETIREYFPQEVSLPLFGQDGLEYREPFFGAGAVGFRLLRQSLRPTCRVWLNDADPMLIALWQSVYEHPNQLSRKVAEFVPSAAKFAEFKTSDDLPTGDMVEDGFRKLALHQMSFSGFGYKSGGPLGGKHQKNPRYSPECRWNPQRLKKNIQRLNKVLRRYRELRITCGDFQPLIESATESTFLYVDPPYYEKGPQLYKFSMSEEDHARLALLLRATPSRWVLSYDDHQAVRSLYDWADAAELPATYTVATSRTDKRPKNHEIVIYPRQKVCA